MPDVSIIAQFNLTNSKQMEKFKKKFNAPLWKSIAWIAALFSLAICILLIMNYIQLNRVDPVNTKTINILVERLSENPGDNALKEEIRELDLLARKAYFTNQWQIRTGGYLLVIGIAVLIIALQMLVSHKVKVPVVATNDNEDLHSIRGIASKWVAFIGIALVVTALAFAFLSHNELKDRFQSKDLTMIVEDSLQTNTENAANQTVDTAKKTQVEVTDTINREAIEDTTITEKEVAATEESIDLTKPPKYEEIIKNFPCFRGPGGNGIASHKNVPTSWNGATGQNIKWKVKIPLHGYNSPVVWGEKVFISGADASKRQVYCYDANTGKLLWTANIANVPGSPGASPKVTDDTGHAAPTLATDGRRVYAAFSNGDIAAFDMDGKKVWSKNLGKPDNHYGWSSSLMLNQNILIIQYDNRNNPRLMALDVLTGKTLWTKKREVKISWASPIIVYTGKQTEVMLSADPYVASYNPYSGKENWRLDCIYGEVGPSLAYADGIVFANNEYAMLTAIKLGEKPEILWESDEYLSDVPSPIATKDYLFLPTSYGMFVTYEAKTGKMLWEKEFNNGFYASPILVNGKIYALDREGIMHIFKADKTYTSLGTCPLGEASDCTPAFTEGRVYIRGQKHLYCIGK